MLELTKASYKEYQDNSPAGFWDIYMTNIAEAIMKAPNTERIAAFIDGQMAASVLLCQKSFNGHDPEIRLLSVSPLFRQKGLAAKLMQECEQRLASRGVKKVVLHTTHLMQIARAMYERSGYQRFEAIDFSPVPNFIVMGYRKELEV